MGQRCRARIGRVFLRQLGKVRARLELCDDVLRLCQRGRISRRVGARRQRDQDVVRVALLDLAIAGLVLVVVRVQLLRRDRELRGDRIQRQFGVLQPHRFRAHVVFRVTVVPRLDPGIVDLDRRQEMIRVQQRIAQLALLVLQRVDAIELRGRQEIRQLYRLAQLADLQRLAPFGQITVLGHADLRQHVTRHARIVLAVELERRFAGYRLLHLLVGGAKPGLLRALAQQRLAHVFIDELLLQHALLRVGHLGAIERLLELSLALLPGAVERLGADALVVDLQAIIGAAEAQVDDAVGAPQREHQPQKPKQHDAQPARPLQFVVYRLQHVNKWRSGRDSNPRPPA